MTPAPTPTTLATLESAGQLPNGQFIYVAVYGSDIDTGAGDEPIVIGVRRSGSLLEIRVPLSDSVGSGVFLFTSEDDGTQAGESQMLTMGQLNESISAIGLDVAASLSLTYNGMTGSSVEDYQTPTLKYSVGL